jgi:MFS family permease
MNITLERIVTIWLYVGLILAGIFIPIITAILMIRNIAMKDLLEKSYTYSYQHYGILWGVIVSSFLLAPLAIFHGIIVIHRTYAVNYIFLVLIVISGMPISIHFAAKHSLFATPRLFLWPAQLLCCFNKQRKQWLVSVTVVYITMTMFTYFCGMVIVMMFAMFAEPYPVILNSLILVLVLFCLINIFAILFTTSAHIFTPRSRRPHGNPANILNAVVLILILIIVGCFGSGLGLASAAVNGDSTTNTMKSLLATVALPLLLGAITLALKRLVWKWMDWSDASSVLRTSYEEIESEPLQLHNV